MVRRINVRKKRKRKWSKNLGIFLFVAIMGTIITASYLYQRSLQPLPPPPPPKQPADEYFSFSSAFANANPTDPENNTILVSQVAFNITAIGGNATNVYVHPTQGSVELEEHPWFEEITQGESAEIGGGGEPPITYPDKVLTMKGNEGYPLEFRVTCNEADGLVTIYVTEFVGLPS